MNAERIQKFSPSQFFRPPVLFATIFGLMCIFFTGAHKVGYCVAEWRVVPDQEKIQIAIKDTLREYKHSVSIKAPNSKFYEPHHTVNSYESVEDFLSQNPNCCSFAIRGFSMDGNHAAQPDVWDLLLGSIYDAIQVDIDVDYIDYRGSIKTLETYGLSKIDLCGKAKHEPSLYYSETILKPRGK